MSSSRLLLTLQQWVPAACHASADTYPQGVVMLKALVSGLQFEYTVFTSIRTRPTEPPRSFGGDLGA